jgi:hypothetical protein
MDQRVARLAVFVLALGVGSAIVAAAAAASVPHPTSGDVVVLRLTTVAPATSGAARRSRSGATGSR